MELALVMFINVDPSIGIMLKSETNYEDMTEILEHYQTYVP